ncbi:MAG: hypothetical protein H6Q67_583 [Firmicutes bacterium]|nr:hypothetical protein [Bacillota bacterium]
MRIKSKCLVALGACILLTVSTSLCFAERSANNKLNLEQLAQMTQKALDYQEIENLMSRHEYYHTQGRNIEELKAIWVRKAPDTDTATFTMQHGSMIGMKSIMYQYGEFHEKSNNVELGLIHKVRPDIANVPENAGIGQFAEHTLTTACIEIAGDGKTAKGMWYSPGVVAGIDIKNGKPHSLWMWEKYGVDFVKEDGQWKIWHLLVCTDFGFPIGSQWPKEENEAVNTQGTEGTAPPPEIAAIMPKFDKEAENYKEYSPTKMPQDNISRPPEPYYTFSETFSY